jgi:broad specificity phosphatase PhoE
MARHARGGLPVRLVLVRHAESGHSAHQVIAGAKGCTGLTERGIEQAHALADRLRATNELGESWSDFIGRVHATHLRLATRFARQTVVAITHAGFVVASILAAFAIPRPGTGARLEPVHTSLTEWRVTATSWTLARYNDAGHLLHRR